LPAWTLLLLLLAAAAAPTLAAESQGATLFKAKCVLCHGADGSGNTPLGKQLQAANLRSKEVQKRTDAELEKRVHDGSANMPPFAEQLSDQEIGQVIRYVRTFANQRKSTKAQQ
jgi:mono/diheme cytochrome c family protein